MWPYQVCAGYEDWSSSAQAIHSKWAEESMEEVQYDMDMLYFEITRTVDLQ